MPGLRLLCLDGGGVRGLASLYMLKQLLSHFGDEKPCSFFQMIAGTSTGGLIAIMLGCLEMTVDECIEAYLNLMGIIFKKGSSLPFSLVDGKVKPRYDTKVLEKEIKRLIADKLHSADALMRRVPDPTCKTFVVALSSSSTERTHFTNYKKPDESSNFYNNVKIWEAARATTAATSFFEPITIIDTPYVDGGAGANNPVNRLWKEANDMFGSDLESKVQCLLSIGTGLPPPSQFGTSVKTVISSLIRIALEAEDKATEFDDNHPALSYFRFNPPYLDEVAFDDPTKAGLIRERTEIYGNGKDVKLRRRRFQEAAARDTSAPVPIPHLPQKPSRRFYELTRRPEHIRTNVKNYWQHLTLPAYEIYQSITQDCENRSDAKGRIEISAFLDCFHQPKPSHTRIREVWQRLLGNGDRIEKSTHKPAFVMACLYMIHIEDQLGCNYGPPGDLNSATQYRREALKHYNRWVPCTCPQGCGKEWNFANDIGFCKGGTDKKKCDIERFLSRTPMQNMLHESTGRMKETMHTTWKQPRK